MDDNIKDDFENITSTPKPSVESVTKEKNPGRVEAGKRLAERNKENKPSDNYIYIGIGVGLLLLFLLKQKSSRPSTCYHNLLLYNLLLYNLLLYNQVKGLMMICLIYNFPYVKKIWITQTIP